MKKPTEPTGKLKLPELNKLSVPDSLEKAGGTDTEIELMKNIHSRPITVDRHFLYAGAIAPPGPKPMRAATERDINKSALAKAVTLISKLAHEQGELSRRLDALELRDKQSKFQRAEIIELGNRLH